jgi:hypothetical protein
MLRTIILSYLLLIFVSGCRVLPVTDYKTKSKWGNYIDISNSYDSIVADETDIKELQKIGFHPSSTSNIKIINYLDVANMFAANDNIVIDKQIIKCINAGNRCFGYDLQLEKINRDRYGNVFLDIFGFRKNTKETGWNFRAVILMLDNVVIYKLRSSQPNILKLEEKKIPLGPLQNSEDVLKTIIVE